MKAISIITVIAFTAGPALYAQNANALINNGNKLYRENNFDKSVEEYNKAIVAAPNDPVATYNLGNAQFRTNHFEEAVKAYDATIDNSLKKPEKEKAFYNKGVVYSKAQKLAESIDAWKSALKLDPKDQEARENLQKALMEQKKQQQKDDQKKDDKDKKKENQDKDKQQQQQQQKPDQPQSKLSKKQVEQLLKALAQKEKEVQQKMQVKNASPRSQEKDW